MRTGRPPIWTPEAEATLRRLSATGASDAAIARELGISSPSVAMKRKRLGVASSYNSERWTRERDDVLRAGMADGLSFSIMATQMGLTRNAVLGRASRLGLVKPILPGVPTHAQGAQRARQRAIEAAKPKQPKPKIIIAGQGATFETVTTSAPLPVFKGELTPTATLETLGVLGCKWPIGDPRDDEFGFCGRPRPGSGPYCTHHHGRAYAGMPAKRGSTPSRRPNHRTEAWGQ